MIGGEDGLRAICAYLLVAAVVEKDDFTASDLVGDFFFDDGGGRGVPVVAGYIPHDWVQAEFAGYAEDRGAATSEGRTEEPGAFSDNIFDSGLALHELLADFVFALESEQGMGEGVVADDMARLENFAGDFRTLLNVAADQKKGCMDAVLCQDIEQSMGMRVVGAVVVGEGDLSSAAGETDECLPVPLGGGRHRLVGGGCRCYYNSGSGECEHGRILKQISSCSFLNHGKGPRLANAARRGAPPALIFLGNHWFIRRFSCVNSSRNCQWETSEISCQFRNIVSHG